ncbi:GntR family transcriptional regulator [Mycoplasmatota bacterium WC44]
MVDKASRIPLYVLIYDDMKEKIQNEEWLINERIPTEKELMDIYNCGRATVRESTMQLEREGFLYRKKGIGTYVKTSQPTNGFRPFISLSYYLKDRGIEEKSLILTSEVLKTTDEINLLCKWNNSTEFFSHNRQRVVDDKVLAIEESYFHQSVIGEMDSIDKANSLSKFILSELGINVIKVDQSLFLRKPTIEEVKLLEVDINSNLLEMHRWIYADSIEEPVHFIKFIIPSDKIPFQY